MIFEKEYERLNLWLPVLFGGGIALYFTLEFEPDKRIAFIGIAIGLFLCLIRWLRLIGLPILFFFAGLLVIQTKAETVSAPKIKYNLGYVDIQGIIVQTEPTPKGQRLTIEPSFIEKTDELPKKIRITTQTNNIFLVGDEIKIEALLSPPSMAFMPNGFDLTRHAWFQQIGGYGYTRKEPILLKRNTEKSFLENIRQKISQRIYKALPNETAGIVHALILGDQKGISEDIQKTFKDSGISHVLSVSGFHLVLVAGFVMFCLRFFLNLFPSFSLKTDIKKISALSALLVCFLYLLISGGAVPAVRSFWMLSFFVIALLFNRQALSIRSVCWAGFFVLLLYPESLISVSFQLSFGATLSLIALYEALKEPFDVPLIPEEKPKRILTKGSIGFLLTNIGAIFGTMFFVIYHFHKIALYSLLGNFLTSAFFGIIIMPFLLVSILVMPLGLDWIFLKIAGFFLEIVIFISGKVASLPFAVLMYPKLSEISLSLISIGLLWLCLWQTKIRYVGFAPIFISLFLFAKNPDIVVSSCGQFMAFKKDDIWFTIGSQKTVRNTMLERDGLNPETEKTGKIKKDTIYNLFETTVLFNPTKCQKADLILSGKNTPVFCPLATRIITKNEFCRNGTTVFYLKDGENLMTTSKKQMGNRLWTPK
ncbi:MAG: ComEC/Rec2 family competence protein [Alphaproteobacteria bacterium]|nr:ComEC/Rec2 family competence protein [Alphaproteobacteria bacterium]